ncbi:MAG: hypothetical protein CL583_04960 [Alteromonadaceae bacterium]|nr:hypothetical protein [Alteromonadaceae bacterium]
MGRVWAVPAINLGGSSDELEGNTMNCNATVVPEQRRGLILERFRPPSGALSLVLVLALYLLSHDLLDRLGPGQRATAQSGAPLTWLSQPQVDGSGPISILPSDR